MHLRTRTWFIISVLCFLAAMVFLQVAERKRARDRQKSGLTPTGTNAPAAAAPGPILNSPAQTNAAANAGNVVNAANAANAVNAPSPTNGYRLSNTTKTLTQLLGSDQALLLRNARIDSSIPVTLPIPTRALQVRTVVGRGRRWQFPLIFSSFPSSSAQVPGSNSHLLWFNT